MNKATMKELAACIPPLRMLCSQCEPLTYHGAKDWGCGMIDPGQEIQRAFNVLVNTLLLTSEEGEDVLLLEGDTTVIVVAKGDSARELVSKYRAEEVQS